MPNPPIGTTADPDKDANVEAAANAQDSQQTSGRLEHLAQRLARRYAVLTAEKEPAHLLQRLETQETLLTATYQELSQTSDEELVYARATEWILDNFYVVQQSLRQVEESLPPGYYLELPQLNSATLYHGYPRVYALAREFALHENCQFDMQRLERFLHAYQQEAALTMGELWALPIFLRFVALESLTQAAGRLTGLLATRSELPAALHFRYKRLANNELVANCIISLRQLGTQDWEEFFEDLSRVEQILRRDPAALYQRMDFDTRDRYRKAVEELALYGEASETAVAQLAVELASGHSSEDGLSDVAAVESPWVALRLPRTQHVGYYLLDDGRSQLEAQINFHPPRSKRVRRWILQHPTFVYLSSINLVALAIVVLLVWYAAAVGGALWQLILAGLLAIIPATAVAVSFVNWIITRVKSPRVLPKLDLEEGVPRQCRTMVVIPSLLSDAAEVKSLLRQLELHYLRNGDPELGFALLTDFADADEPVLEEDRSLLAQAEAGIEALNARYDDRPFFLFHRKRLWNPGEEKWMGWERKRGKLHEFNRLLRGDDATSYTVKLGKLRWLPQVQYVITLDADTVLPRDGGARLIGTLAHPLNQAVFDAETGKVCAGYTVLQPRTEIRPTSANQSLFTRVFGGDVGLDLYTLAVSDVYQDLFGEGTYVGKGIYDVDAFERSLEGRVPENSLLSHDLFEGIHGRAALVTDIVLYEEYPPHYLVQVRRSHRWIRGDWQLLPWLFPWVPTTGGRRRNELTLIDLWKIADNLRRSLVAPGLFLLLVAGWTILPGSPLLWTLVGLLAPAVALITSTFSALLRRLGGATWREVRRPIRDSAVRWLLQIAFLPFESLIAFDAVLVTLWRLFASRRNLLQWTTAAHSIRLIGRDLSVTAVLRQMLSAIVLSLAVALLVAIVRPPALIFALPVVALWLLAAEIAHWISQPERHAPKPLSDGEIVQLQRLARRTWLFFEQYVDPEDHWLPPDHFQEWPRGVVAHRTSPTNVGLYLLSVVAAYDLGYIGLMNMSLRLRATFDTLNSLERYRGHFLNWIDTSNLRPLPPRYVSTVDSGNLAGALLALSQACRDALDQPLLRWRRWEGLLDTMALLEEALETADEGHPAEAQVREWIRRMRHQVLAVREKPETWPSLVSQLVETDMPELEQRIFALLDSAMRDGDRVHAWRVTTERLRQNILGIRRELDMLMPWRTPLRRAPAYLSATQTPAQLRNTYRELRDLLEPFPTLRAVPAVCLEAEAVVQRLQALLREADGPGAAEAAAWCTRLSASLSSARMTASSLVDDFETLSQESITFINGMDFSFLYNKRRQVFHIGYNLESSRLDNNYYDLLASEARIASVVAIAKGDVPQTHWLHLARPVTESKGGLALLSWSGTMFEYLMPPLLMESFRGTLLEQSGRAVVDHQIAYGAEQDVPWGISESGFYTFDNALNYQYRAFGVPGLGFKRGLADDLVIAPYASLLALPIRPQAVVDNMARLRKKGMLGLYGFYEALDFTPSRLDLGQSSAIVRSYMAHHQGMILLALLNYLEDEKMVRRFHSHPRIQSVELLLQEQVPPQPTPEQPHADEQARLTRPSPTTIVSEPWSVPVETPMPLVHYLSNGRYSTMITNAGSGFSRGQDFAYTRWRADTTLDDWGCWLYLQDREHDLLWSAGIQPVGARPESYDVQFFPHMARFRRRDYNISLLTDVVVAPEDDVEIRRYQLTNDSDEPRRLRLTTYGEVVLTSQAADDRHQAFAKLFVESEYVDEVNALIFRRRPRAGDEEPRFLAHMLVAAEGEELTRAFESDRAQFIGRGRTDSRPAALRGDQWLTGSVGATLDPIMSLGQDVEIAPRAGTQIAALTFTAETRSELLDLARRYRRWSVIERAFTGARGQAEQELRQLEMPVVDLADTQKLLSLLLYPHRALRAGSDVLAANRKGQPGLWAYGISGDYPILLLRISDEVQGQLLQEALRAHTYWRRRGLMIDLVIINQQDTNYGQPLQSYILRTINRFDSQNWINRRGGIFILREDQMPREDAILLQTAARVILDGEVGVLADQVAGIFEQPTPLPNLAPSVDPQALADETPPLARPTDLQFDNGLGGFSADGREYVIYLRPGEETPAPWINVIANEAFGFLVSESGSGYSWAINSGENRLTTWRNDPVSDMPAEALYLRDEETAEIWSPTPQPTPAEAPYLVRHGAGYTVFHHHSHALEQRVRLFAAPDDPVKVVELRLKNCTERPRRITATFYAEWVLGSSRDSTQSYIIPLYQQGFQALLARNPYNTEFGERVAFAAASRELHGLTADRAEFLGRIGTIRYPVALRRVGLDDRVDPALDTCAALQLHFDLPPGGSEEVYFLLGQGEDEEDALALLERFCRPEEVTAAWQASTARWEQMLTTVQVETPEPAMDLLLNRWLLYQALSCRIWGRSALYQSSGAYGFRDQLQDVMSLIFARPDLTRAHLLRSARHQFEAGDVLHWWHPPSGRGVRTRITDDLVWLPFVTAHYVKATGDTAVLDETAPFLEGRPLEPDEEERYGHYQTTEKAYTLYEHCCRVLERATTHGRHGLPLMGAGDWNDGMNRVGIEGEGESVWLAWFIYKALVDFADLCAERGDTERAADYRRTAEDYRRATEENAWDGAWYRRAYYDDGTPLGSRLNDECQIDSLGQSWGVLTAAADPERARLAMQSARDLLIKEEERLILLFTPPFDKTPKDPGYIKGYLPGIRENGGQYTHAALWTIWAFAAMGEGDTAEYLFRLINPICRADTPEKTEIYKVEPYVIAADVYGVPPHEGRGGWTWYTGSSGWMYRLGVEGILGLRREGESLRLLPRIPQAWKSYRVTYRHGETTYEITVRNPHGGNAVASVTVDGEAQADGRIALVDDGAVHHVEVILQKGEETA